MLAALSACTMPNPAFRAPEAPPAGTTPAGGSGGGTGSSALVPGPIASADGGADAGGTAAIDTGALDPAAPDGGVTAIARNYYDLVSNTPGLVSYWRMGGAPHVADDFNGPQGATLQSRSVAGHSWTLFTAEGAGSQNAVFTNAGRVRKGGSGNRAHYYSSYVPSSADYAVEADLHIKSVLDDVSLIARQNLASNRGMDWYSARFFSGAWEIRRVINDAGVTIASAAAPTLANDTTHRFRMEVSGSNPVVVRVFLDGTLIMTANDSNANRITVVGRAGIRFGALSSPDAVTDTTGFHLDNLRVVPISGSAVTDSRGVNHGTYVGAPSLNVLGALVGDPNAATRMSGTADYATVADAASLDLGDGPFTLEAWVKRNDSAASVQTVMQKGVGSYQFGFHNNRIGLFRYDGDGRGDAVAIATTAQTGVPGYRHYVATKNGGAVKLYVDGIDVTGTVTDLPMSNTTAELGLGGSTIGDFLNGDLDEVAVYKVVLDAAAVAEHHRVGSGR
ncbi:MAG TPA: LamG domain-containing protein [Polyangia bacterium]